MPESSKKRAETHEPTPIVTFYSYKGGVGRSMAVLNVASLIASRGFRVLIIDFDLEAPGLSHLIGKEAIPAKGKSARISSSKQILKPGVVELLSDAVLRGLDSDLISKPFPQIAEKYTFSYNPPEGLKQHPGAKLSIMPAGRLDEEYSIRLDQLDLPGLYKEPENSGKRLILCFREILIHAGLYDYILVDSRTGHSDEAGICTRDLADHRMVVSGLNIQNITGTAAFLRNLRVALERESKEIKTPDLILSPVPNGEDALVASRESKARREFQKAWGSGGLEINLLIPYHPRLALTEEAYVPAITASPLRNAYLEIEERLLHSLNHTPDLLDEKFRSFVRSGNGKSALRMFQRFVKLAKTPHYQGQPLPSSSFASRLGSDPDFLKQTLALKEAFDILRIYAENISISFEATSIAKNLRNLQSNLAKDFEKLVIGLKQIHFIELGDYAVYLHTRIKDMEAASDFYKGALRVNPSHISNNGNYGQLLIGMGNFAVGVKHLRNAWKGIDCDDRGNTAECALCLWVGTVLANCEEQIWERVFKYCITDYFPRHEWNFEAILAQAEAMLKPIDFKYTKALTEAFLDESKVSKLDNFPRWEKLAPLDPELVNSDGTLRR